MMPVWKWREKFSDERECTVEADTIEEAQAKRDSGDWLSETTTDFYSEEILADLELSGDE
jgi:hypothetical protein